MYNLLIATVLGVLVYVLVTLWLGPIAGVLPALGVVGIALFLLSRRISGILEKELAAIVPLLQARQVDEARQHIERVQKQYGRWQFLLERQLEAQLGMIDYLQMKWDQALPRLERGKWRNWTALTCIAAIHHRQGRKEKAWEALKAAEKAGPKEVIVYCIHATLLVRDGKRTEALDVVSRGLKSQPDSQVLKDLKQRVANKKKVDPKAFGELWYQFFPEDYAKQMVVRGRAGNPLVQQPQPRIGARRAPRR